MICENCQYSVYECEGWEWFLVDCKRGQQLTKDEEYGFINKGLEECSQYRKRRKKRVQRRGRKNCHADCSGDTDYLLHCQQILRSWGMDKLTIVFFIILLGWVAALMEDN